MKNRTFLFAMLAASLSWLSQSVSAQETKPEVKPDAAAEAKPAEPKAEAKVITVTLETDKGNIVLELDKEKAPISVENFIKYVKKGHYDGTIFHRVIPGFMVQGGGFDAQMQEKPTEGTIKNEGQNGLKNARGTIAMARRGDPDSAGCQFFINVVDNTGLDFPNPDGHGYAVFGKVTKGMDVVDAIVGVPTTNVGPYSNVPADPIAIKKATVAE